MTRNQYFIFLPLFLVVGIIGAAAIIIIHYL